MASCSNVSQAMARDRSMEAAEFCTEDPDPKFSLLPTEEGLEPGHVIAAPFLSLLLCVVWGTNSGR